MPTNLRETDIAAGTRTSAAYESLRAEIISGMLPPGSKLRIEKLCERYGTGGSPVREALNRLYAQGFVSLHEQRGFSVPAVSVDELYELAHTRCWINEVAMREAIRRGDAAWEEGIVLSFHRLMKTRREMKDNPSLVSEMERRHRVFHASVIAGCGSRWLCEFAEILFDQAGRYRHLTPARQAAGHRETESEHRAIMEAAIERDVDAAIRALNDHVMCGADAIKEAVLSAYSAASSEI